MVVFALDRPKHGERKLGWSDGLHQGLLESELQDEILSVAFQRATHTLDLMPEGVKRPYATTSISHIVEMAAMLGVHWKRFDRREDRYLADGNGILITGNQIMHLGLMFTFTRYGMSNFQDERVVPTRHLRDLCFGAVSTIFRNPSAVGRPGLPYRASLLQDIGILRLGSRNEISDTLVMLGCNQVTARYCRDDKTSIDSHLFPGEHPLQPRDQETRMLTSRRSCLRAPRHGRRYLPHQGNALPHAAKPDAVPL